MLNESTLFGRPTPDCWIGEKLLDNLKRVRKQLKESSCVPAVGEKDAKSRQICIQ